MSNARFENVTSVMQVSLGKKQTAQTVRISVRDDVAAVLSCGIDGGITSFECTPGEVRFDGKTNVRILYCNAEGEVNGANYNADFRDAIQCDAATDNMAVSFSVIAVDYKADFVGNVITLQILLEISASAYAENSAAALSGGDFYCKHAELPLTAAVKVKEISCETGSDLTASCTIDKVLLAESSVCCDGFTATDEALKVTGCALVNFVYVSEGAVKADKFDFVFSEEIDCGDIAPENVKLCRLAVKNTRIRLDVAEGEVNRNFTAELQLAATVAEFTEAAAEVVEDAYSADCDLIFAKSQIYSAKFLGTTAGRLRTEQTAPLGINGEFITATDMQAVVTRCIAKEGCVSVEGILRCNVLSLAEEGVVSSALELPFCQDVAASFIRQNVIVCAYAAVRDWSVVSGQTATTVTLDAALTIEACENLRHFVISDVEEQPADKKDNCAIEICLAKKGDTVWQIAKSLRVAEEEVYAVNPEIDSPLKQDTRIVVYNKL